MTRVREGVLLMFVSSGKALGVRNESLTALVAMWLVSVQQLLLECFCLKS